MHLLNRVLASGQLTEIKQGRGGVFAVIASGDDLIPTLFPSPGDPPTVGQRVAIDGTWVGRKVQDADGNQRVRCYVLAQSWSCLANSPQDLPQSTSEPDTLATAEPDKPVPAPSATQSPKTAAEQSPEDSLEPVSVYDVIPPDYAEYLSPPSNMESDDTSSMAESCSPLVPVDQVADLSTNPDLPFPTSPAKEVTFHGPEKPF